MTKRAVLVAELDVNELAVRLMSIAMGMKRPPGDDEPPAAIIARAQAKWESVPTDGPFPFKRMALAALDYFQEQMQAAGHKGGSVQ